jgi:hypothetical protein
VARARAATNLFCNSAHCRSCQGTRDPLRNGRRVPRRTNKVGTRRPLSPQDISCPSFPPDLTRAERVGLRRFTVEHRQPPVPPDPPDAPCDITWHKRQATGADRHQSPRMEPRTGNSLHQAWVTTDGYSIFPIAVTPLDPCLIHNWSKTSIEIAHDSCRNGVALLSPAWRNIGSAIKNPHGYVLPSVFLALPLHRVPGSLRPSPRPTVSSPGRSGRGPDCLPRNASVRRLESDRSGGRVVVGGLLGVRIAGIAVLVVGRVRGRRRGRRGVRGRRWVW